MDLIEIFGNYQAQKLKERTWIISFMNGSQYLYLLEGNDKALLIDTGYGSGNLREFILSLTKKTIVVVNTHFHPDHAGGNGEFEEVFMSAGANTDAPSVDMPGATPFDLSKLPYPDYQKKYVSSGYVFDLGDRQVEVMEAKDAHCNSSLFLLDKTEKMLFVGDEFEAGQVLLFDNSKNPDAYYDVRDRLNHLKENAERLLFRESEYEYVLPNHNGTPIEKGLLKEFSELVDEVYLGNALIENELHHPFIEMDPIAPKLCRVRWKHASIFIEKELLMNVYGKEK